MPWELSYWLEKPCPETKNPNDTTIQVVINKSTADYLQLSPQEAVGRRVKIFDGRQSEVVGVVEDFHFASLLQQIGPYCFNNNSDNRYIYLLVKVEAKDCRRQ
jgi:putative ABC transport system permease protein